MYATHPSFDPPDDDTVLWRYYDFTEFLGLVNAGCLHFARVDQLRDPFEGSITELDYRKRLANEKQWFEQLTPAQQATSRIIREQYPGLEEDRHRRLAREMAEFHFVNCWHASTTESPAMWELYASEDRGVAVRTTFEALRTSLKCEEQVWIGKVKYIHFGEDTFSQMNYLNRFIHKREDFAHEKEVRAIILKTPYERVGQTDLKYTGPNPLGLAMPVDLDSLVREVRTAPNVPDWVHELTRSVAEKLGLKAPVERSALARPPVF